MRDVGFSSSAPTHINRNRFGIFTVFAAILFTLYMGKLFTLQVVQGEEYKVRAQEAERRSSKIVAQRGLIWDRAADTPVAMNVDSFAVNIVPGDIPRDKRPVIFNRLARLLEIPEADISKRISRENQGMFTPVEIKSSVPLRKITYLAEHMEHFAGVTWNSKPTRYYPESGSLSHIIGYVDDITNDEIQVLFNQGYDYGTVLGKMGTEKVYDKFLRGRDGVKFRVIDIRGRSMEETERIETPPEPGNDIVLTIDRNIQRLCEKALGNRVGSVVVLKPATGEILAMVSYPWYDPNIFYGERTSQEYIALMKDNRFPFLNRTIQSCYAPASTFKTIMATAMLEEGVFSEFQNIDCNGRIWVGDRSFGCWRLSGHGPLNLHGAIVNSCDIYFYTIGSRYLKIERIEKYSKMFGLGQPAEIDLPDEKGGIVPSADWKRKNYRNEPWTGGDTINTSIGQGFLAVTPLQLADVIAMIANAGVIYRPHVLKEVRERKTGKVVRRNEPEILYSANVSKENFVKVQRAMRDVVREGTARYTITTGATEIAGKTGTAEMGLKDRFHLWFASYGPFKTDNPEERIVVVVQVEASSEFEYWPPKAANLIYHGIFAHMTYEETVATLKPWYIGSP